MRRTLSTRGGYGKLKIPAIDDQTQTRSLTLAYLTHTSTTPMPMFHRIRISTRTRTVCGLRIIFVEGDGGKSKRCKDYGRHNGRREQDPGRLAIHAVIDDHKQPPGAGRTCFDELRR